MSIPARDDRERGANAAEYAALMALAALIMGAFVPLLSAPVAENVEHALCRLLTTGPPGACGAGPDRRYKPRGCMLALSTGTYGGTLDVAFFRLGKDLTFIRSTGVDNAGHRTVTVTAVDNTSAGVMTGVGAGVHAGKLLNVGADAQVSANVKVGVGDSWVFTGKDPKAEADHFIGDIRKRAVLRSVEHTGPVGWLAGHIYDAVAGPDVRAPDIDRYAISLHGNGSAGAGLGLGPPDRQDGKSAAGAGGARDRRGGNTINPNAEAGVAIDADAKAIVEHDKNTGRTSTTLVLSGGASAHENHVWDGNRVAANSTGILKVTKDARGTLVGLDLIRMDNAGGRAQVVTTHLPLTNDADRRTVAEDLLAGGAGRTALNLTWDDLAPAEPPGRDATPLQRLLYDRGQTARQDYTYDSSRHGAGAGIRLGLQLGLGVNASTTDQRLTGAHYLGAPDADGVRHYRPYKECHT